MNKLSELSKPIGVAFKSDIELMQSGRMLHGQMTVWRGSEENQVTQGVYSQEYVSALLAELEAKDKRIEELEAKLATPVRLPTTSGRLGVAYTRVIPEVIEAIRAAGFTVEGGGQDGQTS